MKDLVLSADILRLACAWVYEGEDSTRDPIRFIHVEPHPKGGAFVVSTDGCSMFVAHDKLADCKGPYSLKLPVDIFHQLDGGTSISHRKVWVSNKFMKVSQGGELAAEFEFTNSTVGQYVVPNGTYPDWRHPIPSKEEFEMGNAHLPQIVSADFLDRVGRMYSFDAWNEHREVYFVSSGKPRRGESARNVFLFFPWRPSMFVMLAPIKDEVMARAHPYPEWLDRLKDDSAGL